MINLTIVSSFIKKNLWIFISILLILVFIVLITLRSFESQKKPLIEDITKKVNLTNISIKNAGFDSNEAEQPKNAPDKLPVYKATPGNLVNQADSFAQKFGFGKPIQLKDAEMGDGILYSTENSTLVIYNENLSYQTNKENPIDGNFKGPDELKSAAENFLYEFNLPKTLAFDVEINYLNFFDENSRIVEKPNEANLIRLDFKPKISDLEVISNSEISVTFNKKGEIINAIYKPVGVGDPIGDYKIIPIREAKELLDTKGALVKFTPESDFVPIPENFGTVKIRKIYLAYYFPPSNPDLIQPVWVFKGIKQTENGIIDIIYAVPAIKN